MASKKEKEMAKEYIKRAIQLSQAFETESNRINREVRELHSNLIDKIQREYPTRLTTKKLDQLSNEIVDDIVAWYNSGVIPTIDTAFDTVIQREVGWNSRTLEAFSGSKIARLNSLDVAKNALKKTYQGHTFKFWFNAHVKTEWQRASAVLKSGYVQGKTTGEVVQEISRIFNRSDHDIKTLTRSYMQHAAHEARLEVLEDNTDLVVGYVWISTLDSRTTPHICGIRDSLVYNKNYKPVGHNIPWGEGPGRIHFNCRSTFIPKLKDTPNLEEMFSRPAINAGKKYETGDNKTSTGKPRKPTKGNIEKEIFKVSHVSGDTNYESWLRRQKTDYIADIFNSREYAKDFKAGNISLLQYAKESATTVNQL